MPPSKSQDATRTTYPCQWEKLSSSEDATNQPKQQHCPHIFSDPDELFAHISEDHIGRKEFGNLCLSCKWLGCPRHSRVLTKRDNIVSHVRSHVPHRASKCKDCHKEFKWPQDLKKHCLKMGCTYVEPKGKGKSGPSAVIFVDAKDGTGPALVRYGASLTGGRQKLIQRIGADGISVSRTTRQVAKKVDDQGSIDDDSTKKSESIEQLRAPNKESLDAIRSSDSEVGVLPGISQLLSYATNLKRLTSETSDSNYTAYENQQEVERYYRDTPSTVASVGYSVAQQHHHSYYHHQRQNQPESTSTEFQPTLCNQSTHNFQPPYISPRETPYESTSFTPFRNSNHQIHQISQSSQNHYSPQRLAPERYRPYPTPHPIQYYHHTVHTHPSSCHANITNEVHHIDVELHHQATNNPYPNGFSYPSDSSSQQGS